MKRTILSLLFCFSLVLANAQAEIKMENIQKHVGDSVKICTKIFGGIFMEKSKRQPTLLNAGGAYPESPLTLVIWPDVRKDFKTKPEETFKNKEVCIVGRITVFQDKHQIVIHSPAQITLRNGNEK